MDDDDPLWKRILFNEILWVLAAALIILGVAFHFATRHSGEEDQPPAPHQRR